MLLLTAENGKYILKKRMYSADFVHKKIPGRYKEQTINMLMAWILRCFYLFCVFLFFNFFVLKERTGKVVPNFFKI